MAKNPTKAQIDGLTQAYARYNYSGTPQYLANMRIQAGLYKKFTAKLESLREKFPDIDMQSGKFYDQLQFHADKWWKSRPVKGPGVDW